MGERIKLTMNSRLWLPLEWRQQRPAAQPPLHVWVRYMHMYVLMYVCMCAYIHGGARVCICMFSILVFWPACLYFCFDAASSRSLSSTKFWPRTAAKKSSSPNAARSQARTQTNVQTPTQTRIARSNRLDSNHIQPVLPTWNGEKADSDGKQRKKWQERKENNTNLISLSERKAEYFIPLMVPFSSNRFYASNI